MTKLEYHRNKKFQGRKNMSIGNYCQKNSRRLELSISKKHPARKVGTRSRQCRPKVSGRFAFPGARNPRTCSISRLGNIFGLKGMMS